MKEVIRGDSYAKKRPLFRLQLKNTDETPVDLKGYTVRATLRPEVVTPETDPDDSDAAWTGTLLVSSSGVPIYAKGVALIGDATDGNIELHMTSNMSRRVPVGVELKGDVELTDPAGEKFTYFLSERVIAKDGVTHRTDTELVWLNDYEVLMPEKWLPVSESFEGRNRDGSTFTAEPEGPVRVIHDAWQVAEATTNLVANPRGGSAATVGSGWLRSGAGVLVSVGLEPNTRIALESASSDSAIGANLYGISEQETTAGQSWTLSFYVERNDAASTGHVRLRFYSASDTILDEIQSPTIVLGGAHSASGVAPIGTAYVSGGLILNGGYAEFKAQLENKPYATSYADGDMGDGYSWTGTPHASSSVRQPSKISIPQSTPPKSIAFKYSEDGENYQTGYIDFTQTELEEDVAPSLLLRPEGSYSWTPEDGVQVVTPTVGANVEIVAGEHGQAWLAAGSSTSGNMISVPSPRYEKQTIIVRARALPNASHSYLVRHPQAAETPQLLRRSWNRLSYYSGESGQIDGDTIPDNTWYTISVSWDGSTTRLYSNGVLSDTAAGSPDPRESDEVMIGGGGAPQVESVLIFPEALSDAEVHRISTMPEAWTMENAIGRKYIGKIGDVGYAYWEDGKLKIEPHKPLHIGPIIHFDRALSEDEQNNLDTIVARYESGEFVYF